MSLLDDPEELRANIDMMREMLPIVDDIDKPYYQQRLREMYEQLGQHYQEEALESDSPLSFEGQSRPITPPDLPPHTLKRSLDPTNLPEAKRSRQPSPNNAAPFPDQWSQSLPRRQSNPVQSSQAFIDLTQSDPPTPVRSPQLLAQGYTVHNQAYLDPFPELHNAFTGEFANGHSMLNNNFSMNYMSEPELAAFMDPTPPGHGYGYQAQPFAFPGDLATGAYALGPPGWAGQVVPRRPAFWGPEDSDADSYGSPYINHVEEAQAIEKLLENFKGDGEKAEERAPTPAIMTCTLKEYQRIGLSWLLKMERGDSKGGILADDMGLGKTVSNPTLPKSLQRWPLPDST